MISKSFILALCIVAIQSLYGSDTTRIRTSAQCESCENRIESRLRKVKGIQSADLHVESKVLTVVYNPSIISSAIIEDKVTEIGYDANGKPAKKAAYKRLPACCRKDYQGSH